MIKYGIDVSEHQGKIIWKNVKSDFAVIRAGYGRDISQKDKFLRKITMAVRRIIFPAEHTGTAMQ